MHLGTAALLAFQRRHRDDGMLVLATITGTEGSTYRKAGAMMLISPDGGYEGLVSGGCLEGDLLEHARAVFEDGRTRHVRYDMHGDEDLVWGLGIGCDGAIDLQLQCLERDRGLPVLDALARAMEERQGALLALEVLARDAPPTPTAACLLDRAGGQSGDEALATGCRRVLEGRWPPQRCARRQVGDREILLIRIDPPPAILLCGAGPDAAPLAAQFQALGWACAVADHRPAHLRAERFGADCLLLHTRPEGLANAADLSGLDAAIIMNHHLEHDAACLRQLAPQLAAGKLAYLGVLGPAARRRRLREMAAAGAILLHGPVGLDIGAELPESIALSVAAEVHAVLNGRDGQSLTTGPKGDAD